MRDWLPTLHKGFHERIIPHLIGKTVADRINLVQTLKKWHSRSSAAVSMALTEIMAKICGVSVCNLWGSRLYAIFAHAGLEPWSKIGTDSIEPLEWDVMDNPFAKLIPIHPSHGEIAIPCGCGIGLEIDLEMLAFYHWDENSYV